MVVDTLMVPMRDICQLCIRVKFPRAFRARLWLAARVIMLGAWIGGVISIDVDDDP